METLGKILHSMHEFEPSCYTLETLDEHLLGANNALCTMTEEFLPDLKNEALALMSEYGYDTVQIIEHIFHNLEVWSEVHMNYLYEEAEWTRNEIMTKMECHEASTHFEDYMNQPSREPDPCDIPDYEGNYNCPFDSNGPDDCRRYCGLGVDE